MPNSSSDPLPAKYEIAEPQTYDAFVFPALKISPVDVVKTSATESALKASVEKTLIDKPQRKAPREDWSDANKERPRVKQKDKDKFEPPDDDSGEPAGTSAVRATAEKSVASREAIDQTTRGSGITREKRAVWVVHGMGQQIPFETLDSLTTGL